MRLFQSYIYKLRKNMPTRKETCIAMCTELRVAPTRPDESSFLSWVWLNGLTCVSFHSSVVSTDASLDSSSAVVISSGLDIVNVVRGGLSFVGVNVVGDLVVTTCGEIDVNDVGTFVWGDNEGGCLYICEGIDVRKSVCGSDGEVLGDPVWSLGLDGEIDGLIESIILVGIIVDDLLDIELVLNGGRSEADGLILGYDMKGITKIVLSDSRKSPPFAMTTPSLVDTE